MLLNMDVYAAPLPHLLGKGYGEVELLAAD